MDRSPDRHLFVLLLLPLLALAACSGSSNNQDFASGSVQLLLTDAGLDDVVSFEVDVTGVALTRPGGASVAVLPRATSVDFAELVEVSELFGRSSLPAGRYDGMSLTLDFANAVVLLAEQTDPATIVDASGAAIPGEVTVSVAFPTGTSGEVAPNRNHLVQLDLDLSQSIETDLSTNQLVFEPVIDAVFDPADPKPALVRGALTQVNGSASRFVVERSTRDGTPLASVTVETTADTVYQVDGELYSGAFGVQALALLANRARVWVQGVVDPAIPGIRAVAVEAGDGVPGGAQDEILGWVVGRSAGAGQDVQLTVLGRSRQADGGARRFYTRFTVDVEFAGTHVLQRGVNAPLGSDALQVGQRVMAFGMLNGTAMDAGVLADGVVRALPTTVLGLARDAAVGDRLRVAVQRIGAVPVREFDFAIAGVPELDPADLRVDVTGIDVSAIVADARIAVTGHTNPVGVMSDADFSADRVVDRSSTGVLLGIRFPLAGGSGVLVATSDGLTIDVDGARSARIFDGFGGRDLATDPVPTIVSAANGGPWRVVRGRSVVLFRDFGAFATELAAAVTGGARVIDVYALGGFDVATQVTTAITASVRLR